jgi:bifunctional DNase/RNase
MLVQMTVRGIALDPITNMPIIILKDVDERKALPIWVGIFEANAIALELEKVTTPRPMTHDLLKSVLDGLGVTVRQVIVNDLKDNTFFAVIELNHNGTVINIDSRPSDAIALALRVNAPIFVTENVVSQAKSVEISEEKEETDKWKEWLENLKPEDFGRYRMYGARASLGPRRPHRTPGFFVCGGPAVSGRGLPDSRCSRVAAH